MGIDSVFLPMTYQRTYTVEDLAKASAQTAQQLAQVAQLGTSMTDRSYE
jgi:hypothetical protein